MKNIFLTLSLIAWLFVASVAITSCGSSDTEVLENPSPEEITLIEKEKEEEEKKRQEKIEAHKNSPHIGKMKIITDELGCKWIAFTVKNDHYYNGSSVAVDLEHHPKCENHTHGITE